MKTKKDLIIPYCKTDSKPALVERFLYLPKRGYIHDGALKIEWNQIFGSEKPIFMEICSGNGQWIAEKAKALPDVNWIAVEFDFIRARKIWLKSFRENLPNLFVVCGEANCFLTHYMSSEIVSEAFINFPDPWPKRRHAKNRLIQEPFVKQLARILEKNGFVTLATDDAPYKEQMIQQFSFCWQTEALDGSSYGNSFFASLWESKGKDLFYLKYRKKHDN